MYSAQTTRDSSHLDVVSNQRPLTCIDNKIFAHMYRFPSVDLLSSNGIENDNVNEEKPSPYEIEDNQHCLKNQAFKILQNRFPRTTNNSPRSSLNAKQTDKAEIKSLNPPLVPINGVSILNFNPSSNAKITDSLTIKAMENLQITQEDITYPPFATFEQKDLIDNIIAAVKLERESLYRAKVDAQNKKRQNINPFFRISKCETIKSIANSPYKHNLVPKPARNVLIMSNHSSSRMAAHVLIPREGNLRLISKKSLNFANSI